MPPHPKAIEPVFQLPGNSRVAKGRGRSQEVPALNALHSLRLPVTYLRFSAVNMNIQRYMTAMLHLLENTLHALKTLLCSTGSWWNLQEETSPYHQTGDGEKRSYYFNTAY